MNSIRRFLSRGVSSVMICLLAGMAPAPVVFADGTQSAPADSSSASTTTQSAPVAGPTNGTTAPTGSASGTYHYNSTTGLWENDYYTWDPVTKVTTPKTPLEYTYNSATGMWDTLVWQYNAAKGAYEQDTVSVSSPPAGAITHGGPVSTPSPSPSPSPTPPLTQQSSTSPAGSSSSTVTTPTSTPTQQQTSNGALNTTTTSQNNSANLTFDNAGTITNFGTANATSGNVLMQSNTTGGNATSGNATDVANYLNMLQSQSSLAGANVATFTKTIQGDVTGDLIIDPTQFMQPAASTASSNLNNLKVNTTNTGSIANNVNLNANSGNALAASNTTAGNVTTGNASAIADVVNMINSVVAANQSFMGVINIEGNYTGNILVPTNSLNALLGSSSSDPSSSGPATTNISNNSSQNIANNVDLSAASGSVTASQNTLAGSATSGNSMTNLTILNLTGRNVVAANSLLVFVNVLGSWVGLIMDAPAGATSAALGGGVTSDTAMSSLTSNINNTDNNSITNNITASAKSGNAGATRNTSVGNIASGNASASANIANIIGSNFSLSNWFGVLFINVLGTWHGNFGTVQPQATVAAPTASSGGTSPVGGSSGDSFSQPVRVFRFIPKAPSGIRTTYTGHGHSSGSNSSTYGSTGSNLTLSPLSQANDSTMSSTDMVKAVSQVLGASTDKAATGTTTNPTISKAADKTWSMVAITLGVTGLIYVGVDRVRTNLRNRRLVQK